MPDLARDFNHSRYLPGDAGGFYESYFQRANHPSRPLAFWIRYTIFSPKGRPGDAIGELWAVWFDGETGRHAVAKSELPIGQVGFSRDGLEVRIGEASLKPGALSGAAASVKPGVPSGAAASGGHRVAWDLRYSGESAPLFLLPPNLYAGGFPKAKSLVGLPLARYRGTLIVDGETIAIEDWVGSQNHNWGAKHTDRYAWGQVAGFDNAPDSFLEVATGQLKVGPLWTPRLTPMVLRHGGEEYALRTIGQALRAQGRFAFASAKDCRPTGGVAGWHFAGSAKDCRPTGGVAGWHFAASAKDCRPTGGWHSVASAKECRPTGVGHSAGSAKDCRPTGGVVDVVGRHSHAASWEFRSVGRGVTVEGTIRAPKEAFVGLRYYNPPGGEKWCLNSKIAACRVVLKRAGRADEVLETANRAAFEILTDDTSHGVEIRT